VGSLPIQRWVLSEEPEELDDVLDRRTGQDDVVELPNGDVIRVADCPLQRPHDAGGRPRPSGRPMHADRGQVLGGHLVESQVLGNQPIEGTV